MIQIVIPMAGLGSRFSKAGYKLPKPFIDVAGEPMISKVVKNLTPLEPHEFIFIARREHEKLIKEHMSFARDVVYVDEVTEGAACTVLLAEGRLDGESPLLIANSDQLVRWNGSEVISWQSEDDSRNRFTWRESNGVQDMINFCRMDEADASIAVFEANHPKWSYALVEDGLVVRVAEKQVISNEATVGAYYFEKADIFTSAAHQMIDKNIRVNNEFYVCPVFNEVIAMKHPVTVYHVKEMMGLGTPEDLSAYLAPKGPWT
jgi:NDP-sugar pyrophosphorylase family protein